MRGSSFFYGIILLNFDYIYIKTIEMNMFCDIIHSIVLLRTIYILCLFLITTRRKIWAVTTMIH